MTEQQPLPENWEYLDAHNGYFEGMREIGRRVKAGECELPSSFVPRAARERGEEAAE